MGVRLVVLGSGQDGGSPQVGRFTGAGPERTASSVAVITGEGRLLLFDASPDIRTQYRALAPWIADRPPDKPFDAVFVTHGHMGHYLGLAHLGKEAASADAIPLHAPMSVLEFLDTNEPWATLLRSGYVVGTATEEGPAHYGPVVMEAIPVPHRAEFTTTVAYSIAVDGHRWALYLPDIDGWGSWPAARDTIAAHDVAILDATFGSALEIPSRSLDDVPHPLVTDTIDRFGDLTGRTRIILSHMNHSNELADPDSALSRRARREGFEVAFDGLVLEYENGG